MEMIAMLNGLPGPALKYAPSGTNPNFDGYRYYLQGLGVASGLSEDQIRALLKDAKTDAEYDSVIAAIDASGLAADRIAVLKDEVAKARRKFYQKPGYWIAVAAVAWVGYRLYTRQPVIPGFAGLGRNPATPKSVEGVDKQGRKVKLVVKKDRNWDEWQVRVYVDGKFNEDETYFAGQDKSDAIETFTSMQKYYGLAGLKRRRSRR